MPREREVKKKVLAIASVLFLAVAWFVLSPGSVQAQERPRMNLLAGDVIDQLRDKLELTAEQDAAIRPIIEESQARRRAAFEKFREQKYESRTSLRDELRATRNETSDKLATVLSKEQMEKFRGIRHERKWRGQWRRGMRGHWGRCK